MNKLTTLCLICLLSLSWSLTIKLGSLAPQNSPWDDGLREIASNWSKVTKGKVTVKIYPGGIVGDELNMLQKMKTTSLDAAAVTGLGLTEIFSGLLAAQLPLIYQSEEEFEYVMTKMKPYFEAKLEERGYKVLIWTNVGWTHFFCKSPMVTPTDLKNEKIFVYAGNPESEKVWRDMGYTPIPLSVNEMLTALQSGMVTTFATTPLSAAAFQWFGVAPHMSDMKWSPLVGGVVISADVWNKLPENLRKVLHTIAINIGKKMQAEITEKDNETIELMKEHGLEVHKVAPEVVKEWGEIAKIGYTTLINSGSIDKESYDLVIKYVEEFRNR